MQKSYWKENGGEKLEQFCWRGRHLPPLQAGENGLVFDRESQQTATWQHGPIFQRLGARPPNSAAFFEKNRENVVVTDKFQLQLMTL